MTTLVSVKVCSIIETVQREKINTLQVKKVKK